MISGYERESTIMRKARDYGYRRLGEEQCERILQTSKPMCYAARAPIVGTPMEVAEGQLIPRFLGGAGFASHDEIITALTTAGRSQNLMFAKASFTAVANQPYSYWAAAGLQPAGAFGIALTGRTRVEGDTGSIAYNNSTSPRTMHLINGGIGCVANLGTCILYDRLAEYPFNGSVTAAQNFNAGAGVQIPARDATGTNAGVGVLPFLENIQAATVATGPTLTMTYTNELGTASRSSGAISLTGAAPVNRIVYNNANSYLPWFPMQAGDYGVRNITAMNLSATITSTQLNLVLGRVLGFFPNMSGNDYMERDFVFQLPQLIQLYDDTYMAWLLIANATSSLMHGRLTIAEN